MLVNGRNNDLPNLLPSRPKSFLQRCMCGRLENAIKITNMAAECLAHVKLEPDPFIAICDCLAVRVLVVERCPDDNHCLRLTDDDIRGRTDTDFRCVKKTARWSKPVANGRSFPSCLSDVIRWSQDMSRSSQLANSLASMVTRSISPVSLGMFV